MKYWKQVILIIFICLISGFVYGQEFQFMYGDSMRSYVVYEPPLDPNPIGYPLVIGLHPTGSYGQEFIATSFLGQKAFKEKFIVACPNALHFSLFSQWNAGGYLEYLTGGTDDVGFISAVIDSMIKNYNVDTTRIYLMGHSNGSMMAYRMAAELSPRIAAIATNTGQMTFEYCNPELPVPIIHFHGMADDLCPYEGRGDSASVIPPVDSVMAIWREANHCSSIPDTIYNQNGILGKKWASARGNGDIILYTIEDWGHAWPRTVDPGINATDVMWDFIKDQNRIVVTKTEKDDAQSIVRNFTLHQNYPNPFNPSTVIKYQLAESNHVELKIYNIAGREIETLFNEFQPAGEHEIIWCPSGLSSGVYFYKLQTEKFSEIRKLIMQK